MNRRISQIASTLACASFVALAQAAPEGSAATAATYDDLLALFADWRAFEQPALRDGAPDYTSATLARKHADLKSYQARLGAIDSGGWPIEQQVDYQLVRANSNGESLA